MMFTISSNLHISLSSSQNINSPKEENYQLTESIINTTSPFLAANPDVADDLLGAADTQFPKSRSVPIVPPKVQTLPEKP